MYCLCLIVIISVIQSKHFVSGVGDQKLGCLSNCHIINMALHWAEQVMIQVWNVDGLVDH